MTEEKRLKRRHFPFLCQLKRVFDVEAIKREINTLEKEYGWIDISYEADSYKKLSVSRENLFQAFEDEKGEFSKYHQIVLTEFDKSRAKESGKSEISETVSLGKFSRYKSSMSRAIGELDEANYGKRRAFLRLAPTINQVLDSFKSPISRVRLAKIDPGFKIKPHIDNDTVYGVRYHLAIQTNPKSILGFRKSPKDDFEIYHIPANGHLYFINAGFEHFAENMGDEARIHLVIGVDGQADIQSELGLINT